MSFILLQLSWAGQSSWPPEYRQRVSTRIYNAEYDTVFAAVIECSEDNGYAVMIANKESGIVLTDYKPAGSGLFNRAKIKLDFLVNKLKDKSTKVRLNIHCEAYSRNRGRWTADSELADSFIDEDDYRRILDIISQKINILTKSQPTDKDSR
jgi:hypothetical protein